MYDKSCDCEGEESEEEEEWQLVGTHEINERTQIEEEDEERDEEEKEESEEEGAKTIGNTEKDRKFIRSFMPIMMEKTSKEEVMEQWMINIIKAIGGSNEAISEEMEKWMRDEATKKSEHWEGKRKRVHKVRFEIGRNE